MQEKSRISCSRKSECIKESINEAADLDVDGCLLKFAKPEIAIEVKWGHVDARTIKHAGTTLARVDAPSKVLFVQDKVGIPSGVEVPDIDDLWN